MTAFDSRAIEVNWDRTAVSANGDTLVLLLRIKPPTGRKRIANPVDVAFALDRSGSMNGDPIRLVKRAVETGIAALSEQDRVALVVYDNEIDVIHPLKPLNPASRTLMRAALAGIDARGSTNLGEGWMQACLQLADSSPRSGEHKTTLQRTLLLTDGLANQGITDPGELAQHASQLRMRGISTSTLGVGDHFDEMLLSGMAEAGGGIFQYIPSARELPAFFRKELGLLLATVASGLTLELDLPAGGDVEVISNFPSSRSASAVRLSIGEVGEGEETVIVMRFTTPPGSVGSSIPFRLRGCWTDTQTGQQREESLAAPALTIAPAGSPRLLERDESVTEQMALQRAARDQREALRLDREGRYRESRSLLGQIAQDLQSAPATDLVHQRLSEARRFGSYDAQSAMPEPVRKSAVHANYRRGRGRADDY